MLIPVIPNLAKARCRQTADDWEPRPGFPPAVDEDVLGGARELSAVCSMLFSGTAFSSFPRVPSFFTVSEKRA